MKAHFQKYLIEGSLIDFQWDRTNIRELFNQIVLAFSVQQERLESIENLVKNSAQKSDLDEIKKENEVLKQLCESVNDFASKKYNSITAQVQKEIGEIRDWTESSNSAVLVDVRRFLNTEIRGILESEGALLEPKANKKEDSYMKDTLDLLNQRINALNSTISEVKSSISNQPTFADIKKEVRPFSQMMVSFKDLEQQIADIRSQMTSNLSMNSSRSSSTYELALPTIHEEKKPEKSPISISTFERTPSQDLFSLRPNLSKKKVPEIKEVIQEPINKSPIIPPLIISVPTPEDNSSAERQIKKINENIMNIRVAIDALADKSNVFGEKISQIVSQNNLINVRFSQDIDQCNVSIEKLKELIGSVSKKQEINERSVSEFSSKIAEVERVSEQEATRSRVLRRQSSSKVSAAGSMAELPPPKKTPQNIYESPPIDDQLLSLDPRSSGMFTSNRTPLPISRVESQVPSPPPENTKTFPTPPESPPEVSPKKEKKKKDIQVKIIRSYDKPQNRNNTSTSNLPQPPHFSISQESINDMVNLSIRESTSGFLERTKFEVQKEIERNLRVVEQFRSEIDNKMDREFVDRLFNKFRVLVSELKDKVDQIQCTFLSWVTREELEEVLEHFANSLKEAKDTAVGSSKFRCLLCGKPRTHVSGMIITNHEEDTPEEPQKPSSMLKSRVQTPVSPKKRNHAPIPRDVVQFLTGSDNVKK